MVCTLLKAIVLKRSFWDSEKSQKPSTAPTVKGSSLMIQSSGMRPTIHRPQVLVSCYKRHRSDAFKLGNNRNLHWIPSSLLWKNMRHGLNVTSFHLYITSELSSAHSPLSTTMININTWQRIAQCIFMSLKQCKAIHGIFCDMQTQ